MEFLTAPIWFFSTVALCLVIGLAAQRLLGLRLGPIRMIVAGVFALVIGPAIFLGLLSDRIPALVDPSADPATLPEPDVSTTWFVLLAAILTMLASTAFLVVMEAFVPLGSLPPAVVWGRGLRGRFRRGARYWQIVWLSLRHGLGPYIRGNRGRNLEVPSGRTQFGRALADTLNAGGVTFVKLGQLMATRRDALAPEIITELERLQDDAAPVAWTDVERVLTDELHSPIDHVFTSIDHAPLASASVGQVHAARLRDGTDVVVKVQRPGIRPVVEQDLDIALRVAARLESATRWGRTMGVRTLADGLAASIREELDYQVEAENIRAVARDLPVGAPVRLPMPYEALSTERVLVMERLDGAPVSRADTTIERLGLDRDDLAQQLLTLLIHQLTNGGVFHSDPHAGNILVLNDGRLGMLDFGSVGRLDAALQEALGRLLLSLDNGDALSASDALLELVPRPEEIDQPTLERDIGRFLARYASGTGVSARSPRGGAARNEARRSEAPQRSRDEDDGVSARSPRGGAARNEARRSEAPQRSRDEDDGSREGRPVSGARMFGDLFGIVTRHGLSIPPEVAAVFRTFATAEGTLTALAPGFDLVAETRELATGQLSQRMSPEALRDAAVGELASLLPALRRLPRRIDHIASAAEHGRLSMNVRLLADERDRAVITDWLHAILLTVLATTAGIMGVLLVGTSGGPAVTSDVTLYDLLGYNLLAISAILALRVLVQVFRRS